MTTEQTETDRPVLDKNVCGCGNTRDLLNTVAKNFHHIIEGDDCLTWHFAVMATTAAFAIKFEKDVQGLSDEIVQGDTAERWKLATFIAQTVVNDPECNKLLDAIMESKYNEVQ